MSNLLRNSLFELYRNDMVVLELLTQISFETLETNFNRELHSRLDKESCEIAQELLSSKLIYDYDRAVQEATQAMTRQITELLELVLLPSSGKGN